MVNILDRSLRIRQVSGQLMPDTTIKTFVFLCKKIYLVFFIFTPAIPYSPLIVFKVFSSKECNNGEAIIYHTIIKKNYVCTYIYVSSKFYSLFPSNLCCIGIKHCKSNTEQISLITSITQEP